MSSSRKGPPHGGVDGGMVTCSTHNTRRKAVYCERVPVYDASMAVVDHVYRCTEANECTSSGSSRRPQAAAPNGGEPVLLDCGSSTVMNGKVNQRACSSTIGKSPVPATDTTNSFGVSFFSSSSSVRDEQNKDGAAANTCSGEGADDPEVSKEAKMAQTSVSVADGAELSPKHVANKNRYYELLEKGSRAGASSGVPKKVCWNCGLSGHEKPDCTNMICRTCHCRKAGMDKRHMCGLSQISPFIFTISTLPVGEKGSQSKEEEIMMAEVPCVRCGGKGHLDCGPVTVTCHESHLSCCYCAGKGHTTFDCQLRESQNPDRWVQRMRRNRAHDFNSRRAEGSHGYHGNQTRSSEHSSSYRRNGRGMGQDWRDDERYSYEPSNSRSYSFAPYRNRSGNGSDYYRNGSSYSSSSNVSTSDSRNGDRKRMRSENSSYNNNNDSFPDHRQRNRDDNRRRDDRRNFSHQQPHRFEGRRDGSSRYGDIDLY